MSRILQLIACWLIAACAIAQETASTDDAVVGQDAVADPTAPPPLEVLQKQATPLHLNAIMIAHGKHLAVINGKTLGTGESVDGATVQAIEKTRVQIEQAGQSQWLLLFQPVDVRQAARPGHQEK